MGSASSRRRKDPAIREFVVAKRVSGVDSRHPDREIGCMRLTARLDRGSASEV